jgi:hypothetical protein
MGRESRFTWDADDLIFDETADTNHPGGADVAEDDETGSLEDTPPS